jgi:hypothetical protein
MLCLTTIYLNIVILVQFVKPLWHGDAFADVTPILYPPSPSPHRLPAGRQGEWERGGPLQIAQPIIILKFKSRKGH